MRKRKRGSWVTFELRNPGAKVVALATPCVSTSAEATGHYNTVRSTGLIVMINSKVKASPQVVQDGSGRAQA